MSIQYPDAYDRLLDGAKVRARELREQAIDDFWSHRGSEACRALRSANRLGRGLVRHNRLRTEA